MILQPLSLFVAHDGTSSRSHLTCRYRCGDACAQPIPNTSENPYFRDVARRTLDRRTVLRGGALTMLSAGALFAHSTGTAAAQPGSGGAAGGSSLDHIPPPRGLDYEAVPPNTEDAVVVPRGYSSDVVIRWGDPVLPGAPEFDFANHTAAAQEKQFGYNNDFAALLPIPGAASEYLLVVNHEYTTEPAMFYGYDEAAPTEEQVRIAWAAHGLSVLKVRGEAGSGKLTPVISEFSRRITATTEFTLTGPAAGSDFVRTSADPAGTTVRGTLNNCAGGVTPWGTILSGEENFNQYFANGDTISGDAARARVKRYGITGAASERRWENYDPRFDQAKEPNEPNRFGYIVEINPWDATSTPVKHTALGRFKHEGATIHVTADGTVVAYMGDDERFDYIYKFVSSRKIMRGDGASALRHNMAILDEGTLYVARFLGNSPSAEIDGSGELPSDGAFDGTGEWIPLLRASADSAESLVDGFSVQEVAVFTRLAADTVGATKMDRPEDIEANPRTGKVYAALTNNTRRGTDNYPSADEANPRHNNKNGHILEITDDHAGTAFRWNLLLVCGDPAAADTYFGGFDKSRVSPISCPDNVAFDPYGNLWISTDGNALGANDGLFSVVLQGPRRGETKQFLSVPVGAETCGPIVTEDRVVVCVQHPGESDDYTAESPGSHWPDGGDAQPRPAVVVAWKG
ncbi:PhoX family phosphatase [Hoyosella sp. YIM 151337]|uniref:PhoX family protein n=1 Tax=Hoyosella sp. YIM 151337 TaxID=2992742 RepID=UPI002235BDF6|nr:PhoX family phosphatase [Hoyosella sp. YIM 151337]MCW4354817.1 PhoX family phosphatase [Hoyosella sp. YIM 151337]